MARAESVIRTSTYRINSMLLHLGTFAVGAILTKAAVDFDEQMTRTMSIMTDGSDGMRTAMEDVALSLSSNSITAPTELAKAYYELTRAGYAAAQSTAALQNVERFSVINHMNAADAARHLAILQQDFGLGAADPEENARLMRSLGDSISSVAMASRSNPSAFVEALTRIAPAMRLANQEVGQSVALLASFTSAHGSASRAAQQSIILIDSLQRQMLKSETSPTRGNAAHFLSTPAMGVFPTHGMGGGGHAQDATHAWRALGIEVFSASGMMRPMTAIISDMDRAIGGMATRTRFATLTQLGFSRRTAEAMIELVGSSKAMEEFFLQSKNADGFMENVYNKHLQSFSAQWKIFRNNLEQVGILILRIVGPILREVNNLLIKGVQAWTSLPSAARETTVAMVGAFLALASLRFVLPVVFALFKTLATPLYPLILLFRLLFIDSIRTAGGLVVTWGLIPNIFLGIRASVVSATLAIALFNTVARRPSVGYFNASLHALSFGIGDVTHSVGRGIHAITAFLRAGTGNFWMHGSIDLAISSLSRFGASLKSVTAVKIFKNIKELGSALIKIWDEAGTAAETYSKKAIAYLGGITQVARRPFTGLFTGAQAAITTTTAGISTLIMLAYTFLTIRAGSMLLDYLSRLGLQAAYASGWWVGLTASVYRYISAIRIVPKTTAIGNGLSAVSGMLDVIIKKTTRFVDAILGVNSAKVIVKGFDYIAFAVNRALFAIYNIPGAIALAVATGSFNPLLAITNQLGKAFKQLKIGLGSFSVGLSLMEGLSALRGKLIAIATSTSTVVADLWKSVSNSFGLLQTRTAIKLSVGVQFVYEGISKAVTASYMLIEGFARISRARMIAPHVFRMGEFLEGIKLVLVGLNSILAAFTGISVIDVFKNAKSNIATFLGLPKTFGLFEGVWTNLTKRLKLPTTFGLFEGIVPSLMRRLKLPTTFGLFEGIGGKLPTAFGLFEGIWTSFIRRLRLPTGLFEGIVPSLMRRLKLPTTFGLFEGIGGKLPTAFGLFEGIWTSFIRRLRLPTGLFEGLRVSLLRLVPSITQVEIAIVRLLGWFTNTGFVQFFIGGLGFFDNLKFGLMGLYDSFKSMRWAVKLEFKATDFVADLLATIGKKAFKLELKVTSIVQDSILPFLTRLMALPRLLWFRLKFNATGLLEGLRRAILKTWELISVTTEYIALGVFGGVAFALYGIGTAASIAIETLLRFDAIVGIFLEAGLGLAVLVVGFVKLKAVAVFDYLVKQVSRLGILFDQIGNSILGATLSLAGFIFMTVPLGLFNGLLFIADVLVDALAFSFGGLTWAILSSTAAASIAIETLLRFDAIVGIFLEAGLGLAALIVSFIKVRAVSGFNYLITQASKLGTLFDIVGNKILGATLSLVNFLVVGGLINGFLFVADLLVDALAFSVGGLTGALLFSTAAAVVFETIASAGASLLMTLIAIPLTIAALLLSIIPLSGILIAIIVNTEGKLSSFGSMWEWISSRAGSAFWKIIGFFYNLIGNFNIIIDHVRKNWTDIWADIIEVTLRAVWYIILNALPLLFNAFKATLGAIGKMMEGTWAGPLGSAIRWLDTGFEDAPYRSASALFGSASDYRTQLPEGLSLDVPEDIRRMIGGFGRSIADSISPRRDDTSHGQGIGDTFKEMSLRRFVLEAPFTGVEKVQTVNDPTAAGFLERIADGIRTIADRPTGLAP